MVGFFAFVLVLLAPVVFHPLQSVCVCWAGYNGTACDVPTVSTNKGSRVGVGLTGVAYWSTQHAFGDLMYVPCWGVKFGFSNTTRNPEGILSHNNRKSWRHYH